MIFDVGVNRKVHELLHFQGQNACVSPKVQPCRGGESLHPEQSASQDYLPIGVRDAVRYRSQNRQVNSLGIELLCAWNADSPVKDVA